MLLVYTLIRFGITISCVGWLDFQDKMPDVFASYDVCLVLCIMAHKQVSAKRKKWISGQKVEIYDQVKKKWVKGEIIEIFTDHEGRWVKVKYGRKNDDDIRIQEYKNTKL